MFEGNQLDEKQESQVEEMEAQVSEAGESEESSASVESQEQETQESQKNTNTENSPKEEKKERYVPLTELQKERQRRRDLERRLEKIESDVAKSQEPNAIKEIMEDLQVDEDTAKKLHKHGLGRRAESTNQTSEVDRLKNNFIEEANDLLEQHDDWDDLRNEMTLVFNEEAQRSESDALRKGPEYYYLKAKLLRGQKETQNSVREAVDKKNSKTLASTANGKSSNPKADTRPKKGTRAWLSSLSNDEYSKNKDYIDAELARGGFKD